MFCDKLRNLKLRLKSMVAPPPACRVCSSRKHERETSLDMTRLGFALTYLCSSSLVHRPLLLINHLISSSSLFSSTHSVSARTFHHTMATRRRSLRLLNEVSTFLKCGQCGDNFPEHKSIMKHLITHLKPCSISLRRLSDEKILAFTAKKAGGDSKAVQEPDSEPLPKRRRSLRSRKSVEDVVAVKTVTGPVSESEQLCDGIVEIRDATVCDVVDAVKKSDTLLEVGDKVICDAIEVDEIVKTNQKAKAKKKSDYSLIEEGVHNSCLVYFDLETSGLANQSEILEIAAICKKQEFTTYCTPTLPLNGFASAINNITFSNGQLYYRKNPVKSIKIAEALIKFMDYLKELPGRGKLVLVAHNAKFDAKFLLKFVIANGLQAEFSSLVKGFVDTIPMFRRYYPTCASYKQKFLVERYLPRTCNYYDAHNALADVTYLQKLYDALMKEHMTPENILEFSFTTSSALAKSASANTVPNTISKTVENVDIKVKPPPKKKTAVKRTKRAILQTISCVKRNKSI